MKIYSKIVGILLTLTGVTALVGITIGIVESYDLEDKITMSLFFVPCFIFLHYMYLHNFGFNLKSEIPQKKYNVILILTILSLVISIIVPGIYLSTQVNIESKAKEMVDRGYDEIPSENIKARLKTKYEDGNMLYIFDLITLDKTGLDPKFVTFYVELKDEDGFKVTTIEIKDYTNLIKGSIRNGITSNSTKYLDLKDYLKIDSWGLLFITKD